MYLCALDAKSKWWLVKTDKCLFKKLLFHWQRTLIYVYIGQWRHPVVSVFSDWQMVVSGFWLSNKWKFDMKVGIFRRLGFFSPPLNSEKSSKCNIVKTKVCRRNCITWSCRLKGYWPWATVKRIICASSAEANSTYYSGTHVNHLIKCFAELRPRAYWHLTFRFKLLRANTS